MKMYKMRHVEAIFNIIVYHPESSLIATGLRGEDASDAQILANSLCNSI